MYKAAMSDIFSTFKTTPYTFLVLGQGGVYGNTSIQEYAAEGVFKLRRGLTQGVNVQNPTSTATLHIKPLEGFLDGLDDLIGNGVRVDGKDYRIVGQTDGMNFDTNVLEHITLTLQVESL